METQILFIDGNNFKKKQSVRLGYGKKQEKKEPSFWSKLFKNEDEHKPLEEKLKEKRNEVIAFQSDKFKRKTVTFEVDKKVVNLKSSKRKGSNNIANLKELFV